MNSFWFFVLVPNLFVVSGHHVLIGACVLKLKIFQRCYPWKFPYTLASEHQLWLCHQLYSATTKENFLYKVETTVDFRSSKFCNSLLCQLHILTLVTKPLLSLSLSSYIRVEYRACAVIRLVSDSSSLESFPFYYGDYNQSLYVGD